MSAQIPPPLCPVPCGPGAVCNNFGECVPVGAIGAIGAVGAGAIGGVPGRPPPVYVPGSLPFGSPCPRFYKRQNTVCVLTGSASHSFKIAQIALIMFVGIFL